MPWNRHLLTGWLLGATALTLLFPLILPHYHGDAAVSDSDQIYRTCQLSDDFSATPPVLQVTQAMPTWVEFYLLHTREVSRAHVVICVASSRSPPASSGEGPSSTSILT